MCNSDWNINICIMIIWTSIDIAKDAFKLHQCAAHAGGVIKSCDVCVGSVPQFSDGFSNSNHVMFVHTWVHYDDMGFEYQIWVSCVLNQ